MLIRQGSPGNEFLIVADGLVNVTRDDGDDVEVLAVVTPGEVLGEISLPIRPASSASRCGRSPCQLSGSRPTSLQLRSRWAITRCSCKNAGTSGGWTTAPLIRSSN